ncbi:MAG: MlaD family protein [Acidimicrobiales bacterium]|nr:MlaD family protein [Acidimicrobiales bacterium]
MTITQRRQNMLTGAIALVLLLCAISVGVKAAFGAYDGGYRLIGTFSAAGQGLLPGSDVKVRGVNIGEVRRIDLVDGQAQVTLTIKDGEEVPKAATARIRAKTLFGEKFVDIDLSDADEAKGPFYEAGDHLDPERTEGGFELEEVLADTHPLLQAIDPDELMTVLSALADAGDGLGDTINRSLVNGAELSEVFADNVDNTRQFLQDFAALSDELADDADDLLALGDAANSALPVINEREDELIDLLQQTGRLSNDVADLLRSNEPFIDAALNEGSDTVEVLFEHRDQVMPVVTGLRQYLQSLSSVIRIRVGDGTLMAAVKALVGKEACALLPCAGGPGRDGTGAALPATGPPPVVPEAPLLDTPEVATADGDISDLLRRVLGA